MLENDNASERDSQADRVLERADRRRAVRSEREPSRDHIGEAEANPKNHESPRADARG